LLIRKRQAAILSALVCFLTATGCAESSKNTDSSTGSAAESSALSAEDSGTDSAEPSGSVSGETLSAANTGTVVSSVELSKADLNTAWDDGAVTIHFDGSNVTPSSADGMTVADGVITVTKGGTYVLSGNLDDGRLVINLTDSSEKVHLILNGVTMHSSKSAPITVLQADKTVITVAEGTQNTLSDAAEYTEFDITEEDGSTFPGACIASKDDLTINGSGSLTVNGNCNNGIHCKDDLRIVGGNITVTAVNHGIRGNDSVLLHDGRLTVTSGGDGIKSSTADKDGKGFVLIEGGSAVIKAEQDGIDAAASLTVTGGTLDITSGGGHQNAGTHTDHDMQGGMHGGGFGGNGGWGGQMPGNMPEGGFGGQMPGNMPEGGFGGQMPGNMPEGGFGGKRGGMRGNAGGNTETSGSGSSFMPMANYTDPVNGTAASAEESTSTKGMKAETVLTVTGGTIRIDSADDALHANSEVRISGSAAIEIAAGDDGIHGDSAVTIDGDASVNITASYEGIEAYALTVNGGEIHVVSSDDGFNASGGTSDNTGGGFGMRNGSGELYLNGGYVYVDAGGDGLDSNGNITMTGGTVIVCGPTNNGNGPLDSGDNRNTITVTGGTLMAVGSTGMMEAPEANYIGSAQLNAAAGTLIVVTDNDGTVLGTLKTPKNAQGIVFSANGMNSGYSVYTGGEYGGTLNADGWGTGGSYSGGTLVTSGSGGVSGGGMMGGGRGGRGGF